jgi:STE24 endopeptidase
VSTAVQLRPAPLDGEPGVVYAGAVTDADVDARRYHRRQLALAIAGFAVTTGVLVAWLATGAAASLTAAVGRAVDVRAVTVAVVLAAVGGSIALAQFPLDVAAGFVLPRRAGLLSQRFPSWLADKAKGFLIGGVLAFAAVELVYALLAWSPGRWWLWSAALLAAASVALTAVVPIWIVPLFYRLTPLADPLLRERLLGLADRAGVRAAAVAVADLSRKGRTANAGVVGLGRTRRILLADTLLAGFTPDEIEVVLAHELAHHARGHMARGLALQLGLLALTLGATHLALGRLVGPLGLAGMADPAGMPLLALLLTAGGLGVTPLAAAWSRRCERQADADALALTRAPAAFVSAMERLGQLNLAERRPNRLKTWLFATHPPIEQRVAVARAFEQQLAGAA